MNLRKPLLLLTTLLSICMLVPDAYAQFGGIGGMGGNRSGRMGGRNSGDSQSGSRDSRNERPVTAPDASSYEQTEYRLSLLEDDLHLTPDQSAAWLSFSSKARTYAGDLARERARGLRMGSANTAQPSGLQHLGQVVDAARNRLTALEEVESSAKAFYQTLTPEQKILADMRIPTIVAPRPIAPKGGNDNLPDIGSNVGRSR